MPLVNDSRPTMINRHPHGLRLAVMIVLVVGIGATTHAQLPQTRLYALHPFGAAAGTITDVRITSGADLDEVDQLIFSHPGIFAAQQKNVSGGRTEPVANAFRVAVDPSVPPGRYEVRAVGLYGASNPRPFFVEDRLLTQDAEPNNAGAQAQTIPLGTIVYGTINGRADVDCFRFSAKKDQRIVIDCQAKRIDSRLDAKLTLTDATDRPLEFANNDYGRDPLLVFHVPAEGDYVIRVQDETFQGSAEHPYRLAVHTGPHIRYVWPPSGLPGTKGSFTLYGFNLPGGEMTELQSNGLPLERLQQEIDVPTEPDPAGLPSVAAGLDFFPYQLASDQGRSNVVSIGIASAPVVVEQEPNDDVGQVSNLPSAPTQTADNPDGRLETRPTPQTITVPAEIAGQFGSSRDIDVYTFEAKQGESLWIEVVGQRAGVHIDPYLVIDQITVEGNGNPQTKRLAAPDDTGQNLAANVFDTATDDPIYSLQVPADGTCRLTLRDRAGEHRGDPSLVYRLIVRRPQPDFRLVVHPSGYASGQTWPIGLRRGDYFAVDVLAFRWDGFGGPIELSARDLPYGVTGTPQTIAAGQTQATLVFTAAENADVGPESMQIIGSATIDHAVVTRAARPSTVVWSRANNIPAVSRLTQSLRMSIVDEPAPYQATKEPTSFDVHQGRQLLIPVQLVKRNGFDEKVTLNVGLPKSAKIEVAAPAIEKSQSGQLVRLFVKADSPPGTYVATFGAAGQVAYSRNPRKVERLKVAQTEAETRAKETAARHEQAKQRLAEATAQRDAAAGQLQQADAALAAANQKATETQHSLQQAEEALKAAMQKVAALQAPAETATKAAEQARKAAEETPDDEQRRTAREQADKAAADAQTALTEANTARDAAQKQRDEAAAQANQAADALTAAQAAQRSAVSAHQSAETVRAKAAEIEQAAGTAAAQAEETRKAAEKATTDAANAAKPKNIKVNQTMPPLVITVKPAPVAVTLAPNNVTLKQGQSADVKVTVNRQNNFAGPCTVALALPPGAVGVSSEAPMIAADQTEVVLKITAAADAREGDMANVVVRATMDAGGEAIVEAPLAVKVTK